MNPPEVIVCPLCSEPLVRLGRSYTCPRRHNFDLSGEGYLSLLQGRGNYQHVGDDRAMVQARVRVHRLHAFSELAKRLAGFVPKTNTTVSVLDIGCGDGFFLGQVALTGADRCHGVGIDVSKGALAKAAKAYPNLFFLRADASSNPLPFRDESFCLVLSIFAPRPVDEIRRVLTADGSWLIVTAAPDHLEEIRGFVPLAAIGSGKLDEPTSRSFSILKSEIFRQELRVDHDDLVSLVEMSPSIHRLRREHGDTWRDRVPGQLKVTFSFSLSLLGKVAP